MKSNMGFQILIIALWLLSSALFQSWLNILIQKHRWSDFAARKIAHLAVGLWVIPLAHFVSDWRLAAIPIVMILAGNMRANLKRGHFSPQERRLFPLVAFLAPLVLILLSWRDQQTSVVVVAVLTMTVGDTAAALVGIAFGRYKIPWTGKTIEGALANLVCSALVLTLVGQVFYQMPIKVLPVSAAVAFLESVIAGAWDNPVVLLLLLVLFRYVTLA
jgi:dolichol kinase